MTSNDITFIFKKDTGSLDLRFLEALQGTTPIAVSRDAISYAVSDVFKRLIEKDTSKFGETIRGLTAFSVTFSTGDQPRLKIESGKVEIHLNKLSAQTTALFFKSIPALQTPILKDAPAEAQNRAKKLHQDLLDEKNPKAQQPLELVPAAVAKRIVVLPVPAAASATPPREELTLEEQMPVIIAALMEGQFPDTKIQRSAESEGEFFGDYLMHRVFGKIDSCHFDLATHKFTLNFSQKKDIRLAKLPEGKSPEQLAALKILHGSTLSIAKQVKGQFNIKEGKLTFEPGCLKLNWSWSSAELLGIFQGQGNEVIMQIKYLKIPQQGPVPAQDFVDIIECNLPK